MRRLYVIAWLCGCATLPRPEAPVPPRGAALSSGPPPRGSPAPPDTPLPGPAVPLTPAGAPEGQVGTAHDAFVPDADPSGRWALVCQAREDTDGDGRIRFWFEVHGINGGDTATLYLVRGSGAGEPIAGMIARDRTGRWLVVGREDGDVALLDIERGTSTALHPSLVSVRDELYPLAPTSIAFDPSGQWLLYRRRVQGRVLLVVRQLESGDERVVDPGPGTLISAGWRGSSWLRLAIVRDDLDRDGRIEVPKEHRGMWVGTCGIGSTTFMAGWSEDVSDTSVAWSTGLRVEGRGHRAFGDELLAREQDAWVAVAPAGTRRALLVERGCWPLVGDPSRDRVIADCGTEDETVLAAFDAEGRRELGRIGGGLYETQELSSRVVLLNVHEASSRLLDLETLRLTEVAGQVVAVHGTQVLLRDERDALLDVATGRRRRLRGPAYQGLQGGSGRYAFAAPWLVDLGRGRPLARIEPRVHAIAADRRLLVDTEGEGLHWRDWRAVTGRR